MNWQFWLRGRGPAPLSEQVRHAIVDRYRTADENVAKLSMIRKSGKFAGRKVTHIRVFNPSDFPPEITSFSDLDSDKSSIRYTGRIEKGGYLYLDRPMKKYRHNPDSSI
ncbi:hypothetical protein [Candidatus Lucifugimonas marina]|uniref:Uncharacterized protein n=1 Tax=Candidatus Lucifugimonas marina TaxID=3038979 RepID=A0AAJ6CTN9_9CHLR|nr:hypothetical protein [SAR202 cluster bacterium JH702]MDG0870909.1 hypothetical protein [SAR202 cluster bacterium JH639]WFG35857.1 hypothetical protein GKN94_09165 [SAR202 cluster bacterium JH545]WFG39802.1 hypothetical protein GKO48_09275 [SAR202 cluster bacterium JH1073]